MKTIELELSDEQLRQMRVMGFDTVEAFLEHLAMATIVPNPVKPKRARKASSPRKRKITDNPRKIRKRTDRTIVETFTGYTNKKLRELVEQPFTDTGLEVNQDAAFEELMVRYDAKSTDLIREFTREPSVQAVGSIGFDWQDESEAAPVVVVEAPVVAPAPVLLLTVIPPAAPIDFEWILPPVRPEMIRQTARPVRSGIVSRLADYFRKKIA